MVVIKRNENYGGSGLYAKYKSVKMTDINYGKFHSVLWGISSIGRARSLRGRGNEFEARMLHVPIAYVTQW